MPKQPNYPPPKPCTEYRVLTECGRNFIWSSTGLESLLPELIRKGYKATMVMENGEYEAAQEREQQTAGREFQWKADRDIEEATKTA